MIPSSRLPCNDDDDDDDDDNDDDDYQTLFQRLSSQRQFVNVILTLYQLTLFQHRSTLFLRGSNVDFFT